MLSGGSGKVSIELREGPARFLGAPELEQRHAELDHIVRRLAALRVLAKVERVGLRRLGIHLPGVKALGAPVGGILHELVPRVRVDEARERVVRLFVPRLFQEAECLLVLLVGGQRRQRRNVFRLVRRDGAEGLRRGGRLVAVPLLAGDVGLDLSEAAQRGHLARRSDGGAARRSALALFEGGEPEVHVGDQPFDAPFEPTKRVFEFFEAAGDTPTPFPGFVDVGL